MKYTGNLIASIQLEEGERFQTAVPTGLIEVDSITVPVKRVGTYLVRGRGINRDGNPAPFSRQGYVPLTQIPKKYHSALSLAFQMNELVVLMFRQTTQRMEASKVEW